MASSHRVPRSPPLRKSATGVPSWMRASVTSDSSIALAIEGLAPHPKASASSLTESRGRGTAQAPQAQWAEPIHPSRAAHLDYLIEAVHVLPRPSVSGHLSDAALLYVWYGVQVSNLRPRNYEFPAPPLS